MCSICLGVRRKKTKQEFQQELFWRKRSRKNIRSLKQQSFDLTTIQDESDFSSDEDNFFTSPDNGKLLTNYNSQHSRNNFIIEQKSEKSHAWWSKSWDPMRLDLVKRDIIEREYITEQIKIVPAQIKLPLRKRVKQIRAQLQQLSRNLYMKNQII